MKLVRTLAAAVFAAGLLLPASSHAQAPVTTSKSVTQTAAAPNWSNEQLLTSTVHEAWLLSGKNEATFFEMVTQLAQISAEKRGLTLPDSEAAGRRFGELIKTTAKADTDQLLYAVVDKAVQRVGTRKAS